MSGAVVAALMAAYAAKFVEITPHDVEASDLAFSPATASATATLTVASNGQLQYFATGHGADVFPGEWLLGGDPASYEVRMDTISGTLSGGSGVGLWLSPVASPFWTKQASRGSTGLTTSTYTGTLSIRRVSDGVVVDSTLINLTATAIVEAP